MGCIPAHVCVGPRKLGIGPSSESISLRLSLTRIDGSVVLWIVVMYVCVIPVSCVHSAYHCSITLEMGNGICSNSSSWKVPLLGELYL